MSQHDNGGLHKHPQEPFITAELREQSERLKDEREFPVMRYNNWLDFKYWLKDRAKVELVTYFQDKECLRLKLICEN